MNVSFNGFGENVVTFETEGSVSAGMPVMVSESGKVKAANGVFCGICVGERNGYAAVQLSGYVKVTFSAAPAIGYTKLVGKSGKVSTDTSTGREYLVVDIDTVAKTAGIIL